MAVVLLAGEVREGESRKAIIACNDYLRMGLSRSLRSLLFKYDKYEQKLTPTTSLGTLGNWSAQYDWQDRATVYDKAIDAEKTVLADARRKELMEAGLALDYERVGELTEIYAKLKEEFSDNGLWFTDTKLSAKGDTVDVEVFNKPLIDSLRATLDDIAKEVGGRRQKTEISGANGGSIKVEDVGELSDEQRVDRIFTLLDAARTRRDRSASAQQ